MQASFADRFLDIAQPILGEIEVVAEQEGRAAECAFLKRGLRIFEQALLDLRGLRQRQDAFDRKASGREY